MCNVPLDTEGRMATKQRERSCVIQEWATADRPKEPFKVTPSNCLKVSFVDGEHRAGTGQREPLAARTIGPINTENGHASEMTNGSRSPRSMQHQDKSG